MLNSLKLRNVGPAPCLDVRFAPRLNLITGDNGLGKSFLLDVAWWALTRKWPQELNPRLTSGFAARPIDPKHKATIELDLSTKSRSTFEYVSTYSRRDHSWAGKAGRPWNPGLVIYAQADGGFSVWDPKRNYWKTKSGLDIQDRLPGYAFAPEDVWRGLSVESNGRTLEVCKGLLDDWSVWIRENGRHAEQMAHLLKSLAPLDETLEVGPLQRLSVDEAQDVPSIRTAYSDSVPILHASSGIRRIVALAYMLQWSWIEHLRAAELLGEPPTKQVVMLFDELESHLHPRWQRTILRSVLEVAGTLHPEAQVQLIAATHSPLVLASAEPFFNERTDAWLDLDLDSSTSTVGLEQRHFVRRGTAGRWLTSQAFDLRSEGRSLEAERAIEEAEAFLRELHRREQFEPSRLDSVDEALRQTLPDIDRFWIRWSAKVEELKAAQ